MARERPRHGPVVERTSSCTPPVVPPEVGKLQNSFRTRASAQQYGSNKTPCATSHRQ